MKLFVSAFITVHLFYSVAGFTTTLDRCNCEHLNDSFDTLKKELQQSIDTLKTAHENELRQQDEQIKLLENLIKEQSQSIKALENWVQEQKSVSIRLQSPSTVKRGEESRHSSKLSRRPSKKNKSKNTNKGDIKEDWPKLTDSEGSESFEGCLIDLNALSPKYPPHLIDESGQLIHPILQGKSRVITLNSEEKVTVACLGRSNNFTAIASNQLVAASCVRNASLLLDSGQELTYSQLGCSIQNKEALIEEGTCAESGTLIKVGWQVNETFISLFDSCHDKKQGVNYFAVNTIIGQSTDADDKANTRPLFRQAGYFPGVDVHAAFNQASQNRTIAQIVGSEALAAKYFNIQKNFFLARGHLAPDGDFIDAASQDATYYYVNMAPQWQSFNGGNWNSLERAVRRIATERDVDLTVYTGTYGVSTLRDKDGKNQLHFLAILGKKGVLPVPKYYWKLIHDHTANAATAVIGINNPHLTEISPGDVFCEDVCNQIPWVNWKRNDFVKGYTFCCTAEGLRRAIDYVPHLGDLPLLV